MKIQPLPRFRFMPKPRSPSNSICSISLAVTAASRRHCVFFNRIRPFPQTTFRPDGSTSSRANWRSAGNLWYSANSSGGHVMLSISAVRFWPFSMRKWKKWLSMFSMPYTRENYQKQMIVDEILKQLPRAVSDMWQNEDPRDYRFSENGAVPPRFLHHENRYRTVSGRSFRWCRDGFIPDPDTKEYQNS